MSGPDSSPSSSLDNAAPIPPPRIPDHELLRRIGRGAYGEVWLARGVTGALRAVKIVRRSSFDHDRPFEREFEGILKFEPISRTHESQVDILHVGRGEDYFYYVMELADDQVTGGQINPENYQPRTLKSDLLFHSRLSFEDCISIGIALTTALDHLHQNGLVHRDVKPSNIIFVNGVAKLADIGLVTGMDTTRSYVGTEGFAAPEGPGTPQADLFSLGKVLYEMSTGKDRQEFPELPTNLREFPDREGLAELNAVIAKACRHDPRDRYSNAGAMRNDLELLQSGKSLARLHRVERQLRVLRRTGAAITGLVVLVLAGWFYQIHQTRIVQELANANSRLASEKANLAEENREQLERLDIANGVRLLDTDNAVDGLLWFAQALPLVTNTPTEEFIHRIRIQQVFSQTPRLLRVMQHESSVLSSAFSPDGHRVATGTWDYGLRLWDIHSGKIVWELPRNGWAIQSVRFTRDGRHVFISSSTTQGRAAFGRLSKPFAEMIDAESGRSLFPAMVSNVVCAELSPDDRWLAIASSNNVIRILDPLTGKSVVNLVGHRGEITMLSFSRDGNLLASSSADRTVRLWRLPSGEAACPPLRHHGQVMRAVFSPDNQTIASATEPGEFAEDPIIQTWNIQTGTTNGPPIKALKNVFALTFDETDGRRLFTGDDDYVTRIRDAQTHLELVPPLKMNSTARCWAFSPNGRDVAIGSDGSDVRIWNLQSGELLFPPLRHSGWTESVHFSPDGKRLLSTSDDGTAKLWDLSVASETAGRLQLPGAILKPAGELFASSKFPMALSPDRRHLLVATDEPAVRLIDVTAMKEVDSMRVPDGARTALLEFDGSGNRWAAAFTGKHSHDVSLWRREANLTRCITLPHNHSVVDLRFTPDGERLVTLSRTKVIHIWGTAEGDLKREISLPDGFERAFLSENARLIVPANELDTHTNRLFDIESARFIGQPFWSPDASAVSFSPDGQRFATADGRNQTARIWDAATAEPLTPRFRHGGFIGHVEWSPDGTHVVTAGLAPKAKIWDAATGELFLSLNTGEHPIHVAHWSLDGRFIVTRSDEKVARVWDASTAEPVTPLLKHEGKIRYAVLAANNRLITLSDPNLLRAWDLVPTRLPVDVIAEYARLLCGRKLGRTGDLQSLSNKELGGLFESLRLRAPEVFSGR